MLNFLIFTLLIKLKEHRRDQNELFKATPKLDI